MLTVSICMSRLLSVRRPGALFLVAFVAALVPVGARADVTCTPAGRRDPPADQFRADALPRSQGVTTDGGGWIFSWQGGMEGARRTAMSPPSANTWPPTGP